MRRLNLALAPLHMPLRETPCAGAGLIERQILQPAVTHPIRDNAAGFFIKAEKTCFFDVLDLCHRGTDPGLVQFAPYRRDDQFVFSSVLSAHRGHHAPRISAPDGGTPHQIDGHIAPFAGGGRREIPASERLRRALCVICQTHRHDLTKPAEEIPCSFVSHQILLCFIMRQDAASGLAPPGEDQYPKRYHKISITRSARKVKKMSYFFFPSLDSTGHICYTVIVSETHCLKKETA